MLYKQLRLVLDGAEEQLASICSQTRKNPSVHLPVRDILDAFTNQLCDVHPPGLETTLMLVWRVWMVCVLVQRPSKASMQTMHG